MPAWTPSRSEGALSRSEGPLNLNGPLGPMDPLGQNSILFFSFSSVNLAFSKKMWTKSVDISIFGWGYLGSPEDSPGSLPSKILGPKKIKTNS